MTALAAKSKILEDAGYAYSFDRRLYINRTAKKVFSVEFVDDNLPEELLRCIRDNTPGQDWKFYFSSDPSPAAMRELESALG